MPGSKFWIFTITVLFHHAPARDSTRGSLSLSLSLSLSANSGFGAVHGGMFLVCFIDSLRTNVQIMQIRLRGMNVFLLNLESI